MIEIKNLSKEYVKDLGFKTILLDKISFSISSDKIISVIGPVGSGKSTLLKIIAGLEKQTSGEVHHRTDQKIIFIPAQPSSFPWLNVSKNISFGLQQINGDEIKRLINLVGLEGYDTFHPDNKTYGFRLRISLARSLAHKPSLIVLDEPFNQMDVTTKMEILVLIRNINKTQKTAFLLATSNITEALFLSDVIYLMKKNPCEIFSKIEVNLPDKRDESIMDSEKFTHLRLLIENSFQQIESQKLFRITI